MNASQASHDIKSGPLTLTSDELALFDPLERLAVKMMVANGRVIIEEREAG